MRNLKTILLVSGASAMLALTGCSLFEPHSENDRTAGRALDDKTITETVKHDLNREPVYKFDGVDVKTFNAVVQLSGFVDTNEQRQRAADIAQRSDGVAQVVNNISLKQNMSPTGRTVDYNQQPQPAQQ